MANSDYIYSGLAVNVRHVPDSSIETDSSGNRYSQELPGFIEFGVELDGHFEVIYRRKAAGMFSDIQRAADAGYTPPADDSEPQASQSDATAALEERIARLEAIEQRETDETTPQGEPPSADQPQTTP